MKLRIRVYPKGWIVEEKISMFKWKHITHYAGLPEIPFYYETPEAARDGALQEIKDIINFDFYRLK